MIRNSARDPVLGLTRPQSDEDLFVSFKTNKADWEGIEACIDHINDDDLVMVINGQERLFKAECLWFAEYTWDVVVDPTGIQPFEFIYHLIHRPTNWRKKVADMGLNRYNDMIESTEPIRDGEGSAITSPVYLDGTGQPLDEGNDVVILPQVDLEANEPAGMGLELLEPIDMGEELLWEISQDA